MNHVYRFAAPFDRIRALLEMLAKVREWFPKLSLADLFAIFQAGAKLIPLPDLADEAACRQWCRQLVTVLDEVAQLTTVTFDNSVVNALGQVVEDDASWGLLWGVVEWMVGGKVGAPMASLTTAAKLKIDWSKLAILIQAVVDFINSWRQ